MTDPSAARAFLLSEIEALEPFEFVAVAPAGRPQHVIEATRCEDGQRENGRLEVRVPGRPPPVPALSGSVRSALRDREFVCEDPADQIHPWVRVADDGGAAVQLIQDLLVDVFGEKPEAKLDISHGSHRAEHEARLKLDVARSRIEPIVTEILGRRPDQDADGDYILPIDQVHIMVAPRASPDGQVIVRVFAITNVGIGVTPELGLLLARLNFGLMFGRFALDAEHRSIWFDETLLGEQFREEELRFAIRTVSTTADLWDDRLKQMFGGQTHQEVVKGRTPDAPPLIKPGEGVGQYL